MKTEAFASMTIQLPFRTAKAIIHTSERDFLLPRQVIARSLGEPIEEPVIFKIPDQDKWRLADYSDVPSLQNRKPEGRGVTQQKRIYLAILSQIISAMPERFAEVAPILRGSRRAYFGKTREQVEGTGKSNKASRIPETDWWAGEDNDRFRKEKILAKLMRSLGGFSEDYISIISKAPYEKFPPMCGVRFAPY